MVAPCSPFLGHVSGQLHEGIGSPTFCLHQLPHCHGNTRTRRLPNRSEYLKVERRQFGSLQLKTDSRDNDKIKAILFLNRCATRPLHERSFAGNDQGSPQKTYQSTTTCIKVTYPRQPGRLQIPPTEPRLTAGSRQFSNAGSSQLKSYGCSGCTCVRLSCKHNSKRHLLFSVPFPGWLWAVNNVDVLAWQAQESAECFPH